MSDDTPNDRVHLRHVLLRMSQHLSLLAKRARALEGAAESLCTDQSTLSPEAISHLQNIDFLQQSIDDLCLLTFYLGADDGVAHLTAEEATQTAQHLALNATKMLLDVGPFTWHDEGASNMGGEPQLF